MSGKVLRILAVLLFLSACEKNTDLTPMTVQTQNGEISYKVETAVTHEEMARGLMDRKSLRKDSGMIFNLAGERSVAMWMQDTYIPLDMIFIGEDGKICWIYENAEPMSTKLIRPECSGKIIAVVEINAGDVKKNGMRIGDQVHHAFID